ncbi:hypothetical protein, partial [Rheinheimera sp.]|uniref:hypothetical protein n=1 Tax=Rheinheimera sp. TaxID=1869214 RepID=UPI00307D01DF
MNTKLLISAMAIVSFWPCAYAAVISPAALDASQGSPIVQTKALLQHQDLMTAEPLNWTEANSRVNQLGGWQAYMQESGMDHSKHQGMDHSKHQGMDHSKHQGMDHSKHQ